VVIGLCGGVGAGKSAVARAFARAGAFVSDSDVAAREVLGRADVRDRLVEWWGGSGPGSILDDQGRVDRAKVADRVFGDATERARLEGLVHPLIHAQRRVQMAEARAQGRRVFVIDAPLLLEAGVDKICDEVVFVDAPRAVRLARVKASRGWSEHELDRREAAQWPLDRKRAASGYVITSGGTGDRQGEGDELDGQVAAVLESTLKRAGRAGGDRAR
jgi:dephospho-CoA kinase